jgi:hypothetical protein
VVLGSRHPHRSLIGARRRSALSTVCATRAAAGPAVLKGDIECLAQTGDDRRHLKYVDDGLPDDTDNTQAGQ